MTKPRVRSTQQYLDLAEIKEGIVVMRDGGLRLVLMISPVNFALKSENEQGALIFQYQSFLNSLDFPIQILIQSRKLDLGPYLQKLEVQKGETTNELLRMQIEDYAEFIKRLLTVVNIMTKKFYIIIPFMPANLRRRGIFDKIIHPAQPLTVKMSDAEFKSYREELLEKTNVVIGGLASLGLRAAPLSTQQIIELFYATYNPEESARERLTEAGALEAPIVSKSNEAEQK